MNDSGHSAASSPKPGAGDRAIPPTASAPDRSPDVSLELHDAGIPGYFCRCGHCGGEATFRAPYFGPLPSRFAIRCVVDCRRVRVFEFEGGSIADELTQLVPKYCVELSLRGRALREVADLLVGASELRLVAELAGGDPDTEDSALRGAAVHLRVGAETITAYCLALSIREQRTLRLGQMTSKVRAGKADRRLFPNSRQSFLDRLDWLTRLGDSAAHPVLENPHREIPPTGGNLAVGFDKIRDLLNCVRFRPRLQNL